MSNALKKTSTLSRLRSSTRAQKKTHRSSTERYDFLPPKLRDLFFEEGPGGVACYVPSRFKVAYGGRGSGKSWGFASLAAVLGTQMPLRILCAREFQTSIKDSIYKLIVDRIYGLGLGNYYDIQAQGIYGLQQFHIPGTANAYKRTEFIFAGIKTDPHKIKSMHSVDICLVEEAERVSELSWRLLIPTIRTVEGSSEIWVCFNPREEDDPTYQRFVLRNHSQMRRTIINWSDNPWFARESKGDREADLLRITEAKDDDERVQAQAEYDHIWEGACQRNSNAAIFRRRVIDHKEFDDPPEHLQTRFYLGSDFGFANDPTTLIRFWVTDHERILDNGDIYHYQELWISHEAYGWRVEIDQTPKLYDIIPGARTWPIKADSARPETISYLARQGFQISAAEKWPGSVEDGIEHIKAFEYIHIHPRCTYLKEEARKYSYKIDKITNQVLPQVVDAWNHGWDAIRYGLDGYIQRRGVIGQWAALGK